MFFFFFIKHDLAQFAGHCWQHLRGSLGLLQTWHVLWDQRAEGAAASEDIQDHQVSWKTSPITHTKKPMCFLFPFFFFVCFHKDQQSVTSLRQILGLSQEPGCVPHELHEIHHQPAVPSLSLHRGVCPAGDAALRRKVRKTYRLFFFSPPSVWSVLIL